MKNVFLSFAGIVIFALAAVGCSVQEVPADVVAEEVTAGVPTPEPTVAPPVVVDPTEARVCEPVPPLDHCPPAPTQCTVDDDPEAPGPAPTAVK
jgi:hypothetical protein